MVDDETEETNSKDSEDSEEINFEELDFEMLNGGKAGILGKGAARQILVQPEGDKYYYNYKVNPDAKGRGVWLKGNKDTTSFKPVFWISDKKRSLLTSLHLQKATRAGMQSVSETEEVAKYEIPRCGGWSRTAKACGAIITVASAAAAGAQLMKMYGPEKTNTVTNTVNVPVDKWHNETKWNNFTKYVNETKWNNFTKYVNETKWNNFTKYVGVDLVQATIENCSNIFNLTEIKNADNATLLQWLGRDDLADKLTADPALWADIKAVDPAVISKDLYTKNISYVVSLIHKAGYNSGTEAGKAAADKLLAKIYGSELNETKSLVTEYTASDWKPYETPTLDNLVAVEELKGNAPDVNNAFADHYIADYFNHTGLVKKVAYTDATLHEKVQAGIEYKYTAIDFENDRTASKLLNESGNAREASLKALKDAAAYSWLTSNYEKNITEDLTDKIALNSTLKNSTVGKAMFDLSNFDADKITVYTTADGAFIQGYKAGLPVAKTGAEGGYKISAEEYTILKNL
jgi:hypothetical protein